MYTLEYREYDNDQTLISQGTFNTEDKREAWIFFKQGIQENFVHDFWDYINWGEKGVETVHYDERGYNVLFLRKWEGFDDDITLAWEYEGKRYKTLKELWEAEPQFNECYMEIDRPFIRNRTNTAVADLVIDVHFGGEYRVEPEKKIPPTPEMSNNDDLPF